MEEPPESNDLIRALEQATAMAKQLHTITTDQSRFLQIQNSLHSAHHHLSFFLSNHPLPENSHSETGGGGGGGDPMDMEDDEHNSKDAAVSVCKVEERMRECFIRNKRTKRHLSPSSALVAEQERMRYEDHHGGGGGVAAELDYVVGSKLRDFELIYQFHA